MSLMSIRKVEQEDVYDKYFTKLERLSHKGNPYIYLEVGHRVRERWDETEI